MVVARIHKTLECLTVGNIAQKLAIALKLIQLESLAAPPRSALAQTLHDRMDRQAAVLAHHLPNQTLALVTCNKRDLAQSGVKMIEQARPTRYAQKRRQGRGQRIRGIVQSLQAFLEHGCTVWAGRGFAAALALQAKLAAVPGRQVQEEHGLAFDVRRPPLGDVPFPIGQGKRIGAHIDPSGQEGACGAWFGRSRQKISLPSDEILEA